MAEMITIPAPHVPFGPQGVPANEADAQYIRSAAHNIRDGYSVGGYNVTTTVVNLLLEVAEALDGGKSARRAIRDDGGTE